MAEVVVNITANTGQATDGVDNLNKSLNQTDVSAAALETTLKRQEAQIKVIDGAINVLGGSVELLAGGLALSGAVTEEQAKQFETAAIGAIAFADGAKRTLDGVKNLNEGLKVYGGVSAIASKATKALNAAILANPYVAAAIAIVGITSAILLFVNASKDEEKQNRDTTESINERITAIKNAGVAYSNAQQKLTGLQASAEAANRTVQESIDLEKQRIQESISGRTSEVNLIEQGRERAKRAGEEQLELFEAQLEESKLKLQRDKDALALLLEAEKLNTDSVKKSTEERKKSNIEVRNARLEYEGFRQVLKNLSDEVYAELFASENKWATGAKERIEEVETDLDEFTFFTLSQLDEFNKAQAFSEEELLQTRLTSIRRYYDDLILQAKDNAVLLAKLEEAKNDALEKENDAYRQSEKDKRDADVKDAISATLGSIAGFASVLASVQSDTNEEAFEQGKKYKIAQVVTSAIQSAFEAYGAAQKFNGVVPGLGTAIGIANVAAIAIASKKAIQGIQSSTFGGSPKTLSAPNTSTPTVNTGFQGGGQFLPNTAPQVTPPIRAYVVTGDVTNGQVAEQQLQTRRRFG